MVKITYFDDRCKLKEEEIMSLVEREGEILKDNERSLVKVIEVNGEKILIKQPRNKNRRKWIRFLTLFRQSEVISNLKSMEILNKNNILSNIPLFAVEYKKLGMVVDSYAFYTYLPGKVVGEEEAGKVIELLKKIHKLGYIHGDTQKRNFLEYQSKLFTIDSNLKRKKLGKISENLEYIGFAVDINSAYEYINTPDLWYKFAKFIYETQRSKRRIKNKIRGKRV